MFFNMGINHHDNWWYMTRGLFHFTIPYERLTPYLTESAEWCLRKFR